MILTNCKDSVNMLSISFNEMSSCLIIPEANKLHKEQKFDEQATICCVVTKLKFSRLRLVELLIGGEKGN